MTGSRIFNGKKYSEWSNSYSKKVIDDRAKQERKLGNMARITKGADGMYHLWVKRK